MYQNMKNFYELLAIKKKIDISLTIVPAIDTQFPKIKIKINEKCLYENIVKETIIVEHKIELLENLDIKIQLYDKDYNKSQKVAATVQSLKIDLFEIIPQWTHLAIYKNGQSAMQPTNDLVFNSTWNLKINEPFYRWKHRITGQGWLLEP